MRIDSVFEMRIRVGGVWMRMKADDTLEKRMQLDGGEIEEMRGMLRRD